jgi:hypothetical protein
VLRPPLVPSLCLGVLRPPLVPSLCLLFTRLSIFSSLTHFPSLLCSVPEKWRASATMCRRHTCKRCSHRPSSCRRTARVSYMRDVYGVCDVCDECDVCDVCVSASAARIDLQAAGERQGCVSFLVYFSLLVSRPRGRHEFQRDVD